MTDGILPPDADEIEDALAVEGMTPDDLDGHSLDELQDYLDSGRSPIDLSIEESASCLIALDALARLRRSSIDLFDAEVAAQPPADDAWIRDVMSHIGREARAGRRIPLRTVSSGADLGIMEGALRGAVRAAGDDDPDVLVGRCRFDGDVEDPDAVVDVNVTIGVRWGRAASPAAERARARIRAVLEQHSQLNLGAVNVRVDDLWSAPSDGGRE